MIILALILSFLLSLSINNKIACYSILHLVSHGILSGYLIFLKPYFLAFLFIACLMSVLFLLYSFAAYDDAFLLSIEMTDNNKTLIYDLIIKHKLTEVTEIIYEDGKYKIKFHKCPSRKKFLLFKDINKLFFEKIDLKTILYFIVFSFLYIATILEMFGIVIIIVSLLLLYGRYIIDFIKEKINK